MSKKVSKVQAELDAIAQRQAEIQSEQANESNLDSSALDESHPTDIQRPTNGRSIVSGAGYHDFAKYPKYQGNYLRNFLREKDDATDVKKKKGDIIGYVFIDGAGRETIIGASFMIEKALKEIGFSTSKTLYIEFLGKVTVKGKPLNRFDIIECA